MGKKSDPPPPPDYAGAAQQTAQSSQEAQTRADWANRPTQNTPWGQSSWSSTGAVDPATGKPVTNWTQNITLSPQQQQALDQQMQMQAGRSDLAQNMMGRVGQATEQPFNWQGLPAAGQAPGVQQTQTNQTSPGQQLGYMGAPQGQLGYMGGPGEQVQTNVRDFSGGQQNVSGGGLGVIKAEGAGQGIQKQLDPSLYGDQGRQRIENAMMERMRPEHERQTAGLETKLANMGLTRGSEAWNREAQRMGDQQSRERFNALDRGLAEQQGQFGMARGAGEFQNAAQAQGFGQNFQNAGLLANQQEAHLGRNLQAGMANQQAGLGYAGLGQQGDIARSQLGLQSQAQNFGQGLAANQFNQGINQQNFGQNLATNQYNQGINQQNFGQNLQANAQNFGQNLAANQQNFGQGMQAADYANRMRQQGISEQMMQRNMPLNEMNALLTGQQVGMPQMPGFQGSQSAGGANYLGAANMGYNASMNNYNAAQAQQQGLMSGLGSLAGMGMMAFSDIRLKDNIERVGTHPVGVGVYEYDIFGRRERGVIAQELMQVRPDLVAVHDSGYLMVNYGGLQ